MWTKKGRIRRAEVRTVQRVEGFTARLKREALREPEFAGDCHVNIEVPGARRLKWPALPNVPVWFWANTFGLMY